MRGFDLESGRPLPLGVTTGRHGRLLGSKWAAGRQNTEVPSRREGWERENGRRMLGFLRCPRQESNLDLPLRRRSSYPLDYEGAAQSATRPAPVRATAGPSAVEPRPARPLSSSPTSRWVIHSPIVLRAEAAGRSQRELVPVERRPFQALAAALAQRARRPPPAAPGRRRRRGGRGARRGPRARRPGSRGSVENVGKNSA